MKDIQLSPEELKNNGGQFIRNSEEVNSIIKKTTQLKEQMSQVWKGSASEAFMAQYDELKPKMDEFVELIHKIGDQAIKIGEIMAEADQNIANQIK